MQVGDAYDLYSYSKFARALVVTPEAELRDGRVQLEQLWASLRKVAPKAKCYQLYGNHDDRPLKRALDSAPELAPLVGHSLRELFSFPGVTTVHDSKEELFIGDMCFQHGHYARIGDHARYNQCNTVHGHTHRGGTWFGRNRKGLVWELDCGVLGDPDAFPFGYRAQRKIHTCTVGLGLVTERGPVFEGFPG